MEYQATKVFKGFLILDWKRSRMEVKKRKPKNLSPYHVCLDINVKINVPSLRTVEIKGEFTIPEIQVKEAILEEL
jgi:hypothetical protein